MAFFLVPAPGIGNRTYAEPLWVGQTLFIGFLDLNQRVTIFRTEPNPNFPAGGPRWPLEGRSEKRPEAAPGRPAMGVVMPGPRGCRRGAAWGRRGHFLGPVADGAGAFRTAAPARRDRLGRRLNDCSSAGSCALDRVEMLGVVLWNVCALPPIQRRHEK